MTLWVRTTATNTNLAARNRKVLPATGGFGRLSPLPWCYQRLRPDRPASITCERGASRPSQTHPMMGQGRAPPPQTPPLMGRRDGSLHLLPKPILPSRRGVRGSTAQLGRLREGRDGRPPGHRTLQAGSVVGSVATVLDPRTASRNHGCRRHCRWRCGPMPRAPMHVIVSFGAIADLHPFARARRNRGAAEARREPGSVSTAQGALCRIGPVREAGEGMPGKDRLDCGLGRGMRDSASLPMPAWARSRCIAPFGSALRTCPSSFGDP